MRSINAELDLGNGHTLQAYTRKITAFRNTLSRYNTTVALLDDLQRQLKIKEIDLRETTEKMLLATAAKYGVNSREYGQAGGTPRNERRRPTPKSKPATPVNSESSSISSDSGVPAIVNNNGNSNGNVNQIFQVRKPLLSSYSGRGV